MMTPQDDLIGHQASTSFAHVGTSDPAWMERLWYTAHPTPGGEMILDVGLGFHPNRNVMDGFAGITIGQTQYNFRASRRAWPNPLETAIGPFQIQVIEGFRRHRLVLGPNESPLTFDLEFIGTMNPHEEEPHLRRRAGRITEDMARLQQLGAYSGWIKVGDRNIVVEPGSWLGQRDHSWGIRGEMRTDESDPPTTFYPPFLYAWTTAQFPTRGLHLFFKERSPGDTIYISGEEVSRIGEKPLKGRKLAAIEHAFQFADDAHGLTLKSAELDVRFSGGSTRRITVRALPARYFLKGGLYGGLNGWKQGDDKGVLYEEVDSWDLSQADVRTIVRTLADHVIEVRDGDEVGYGIMECGIGRGYARYPHVQHHPAI
jgi:hypothetical protein